MASLQCSKCGEGIHYHGIPQDIEYIYFSKDVWNTICSTNFDKTNKVMDESGNYPKLFRSSTIENDYQGQYLKIWKCQKCGTLHFFSDEGSVKKVFIIDDKEITQEISDEGIIFGDHLWDEITEKDIPNNQLISIRPSFFVKIGKNYIIVSDTQNFSSQICYKEYSPEWMK